MKRDEILRENLLSYGLQEVAKYMHLSPVRQPSEYWTNLVNKKAWAELPDDLKGLVQTVSLEEAVKMLAELTALDAAALEKFKGYGVTVGPIPKDIENELIKQAKIFYDEQSAKDPAFAKIFKSQEDFGKRYYGTYPVGL